MDEEQAKAIWLRAAELQAEAAQRLEERSRQLAPGDEPGPADGLSTDVVRSAALEAGIGAEFIDLALAEARTQSRPTKKLVGWKDRSATKLLGTSATRIDETRIIDAPPGQVLEAMQKVLPNHPYQLTLRDSLGEDLLDGGVLVFEVPKLMGTSYTSFSYRMSWADLRELRFTLRPLDDGTRTEVHVTVPLTHSRRINWIAGNSVTGVGGLVGGMIGIGVAKATAVVGAMVAAPIAAGALGVAGLGSWGIRAAYRAGLRKGREEIDGILRTLAVTCRLGESFLPSAPPPRTGEGGPSIDSLLG